MLKVAARSKRGAKQIKRHGNKWMPVQADRCVGCLGGAQGIKLMSVQDRATFWIKVEDDANLMVVERLDNFGNRIPRPGSVMPLSSATPEPVPLSVEFKEEPKLSATQPQTLDETILERAGQEFIQHVYREVLKEFITDGSFGQRADDRPTQDNPAPDPRPAERQEDVAAAA